MENCPQLSTQIHQFIFNLYTMVHHYDALKTNNNVSSTIQLLYYNYISFYLKLFYQLYINL